MSASSPPNWTARYNWSHNQCHCPFARAAGATRAVLEAGILSRHAVRLYTAAGDEMIEPYSGQYPGSRTNKGFSRLL
jgi:hypothetical protein